MSVEVKVGSFDKVINSVIDGSEKAMIQHALEIRKFMWRFAPYGFGELRSSFKVTDLIEKQNELEIRVESDIKYAKKVATEEKYHMKFRGDNPQGQRSFTELGERGLGREERYWSGIKQAGILGEGDEYVADYDKLAVEAAGGDEGLKKRIQKAIDQKLGG